MWFYRKKTCLKELHNYKSLAYYKKIELIYRKEFIIAALNINDKTFIIYLITLGIILIYLT